MFGFFIGNNLKLLNIVYC